MESISPITLRKALDTLVLPAPDARAPTTEPCRSKPRRKLGLGVGLGLGVAVPLCTALMLGVVWL